MFIRMCMDLFNIGVEVWLAYWLFDVPGHRRFKQAWVRVLEYLLFFGLIGGLTLVNRLIFGTRFSNGVNLLQLIIYFVLAIVFLNWGIFKSFAWACIYFMSISVLELPGIILTGWITNRPYLECNFERFIYDYIYLDVLSIILLVLVTRIRKSTKLKLANILSTKMNFLLIGFAIIEWWIIAYFLNIGFKETGSNVFFYNLLFIAFMLLLMIVVVILSIYQQIEREMHLKDLHDVAMNAEYDKIKAEYQNKSKEMHDLKHQINTLDGYLQEFRFEEARLFLKEMSHELFNNNNRIQAWSGCPLIDMMLDSKVKKATADGIDIVIDVSPVTNPLSERDMSILLGNILDNAIEAANKVEKKQKKILVKIYSKGNLFGISVQNRIAQMPVIQNGRLVSTKEKSELHGWGMFSIQSIVNKYNGQMETQYDNNYFRIDITFFS